MSLYSKTARLWDRPKPEIIVYSILTLLPFHGLFTVWFTSLYGYGLAIRSWKEILLLPVVLWIVWRLYTRERVIRQIFKTKFIVSILMYCAFSVFYFAIYALQNGEVTTANIVGLVVNIRFLIFFMVAYIVFYRITNKRYHMNVMKKVVAIPASIVAAIALLQVTILPKDHLTFFGFVKPKFQPVLYIDQDNIFLRARSTLRGPNELGAYLVTPLLLLFTQKRKRFLYIIGGLLFLGILTSYSRSALLAALIGIGLLYARQTIRSIQHVLQTSKGRITAAIGLPVIIIGGFLFAQTNTFSTLIFHDNTENETVGSTEIRVSNFGSLIRNTIEKPFGGGLGSSGPASQYGSPNIPDNYYVQLVQEVGFIGLILFLITNYYMWRSLRDLKDDKIAKTLAACFVGLMISNFFLHNWADDSLSMYFFGLSGWYLGMNAHNTRTKSENI